MCGFGIYSEACFSVVVRGVELSPNELDFRTEKQTFQMNGVNCVRKLCQIFQMNLRHRCQKVNRIH